ncbi:9280_t:CDS:2, partial [Acaulospora colombiana]
ANCVSEGNLAPEDGRSGGGVSFDSVDGSDAEVGVRSLVVDMAVEIVSAAVVETKLSFNSDHIDHSSPTTKMRGKTNILVALLAATWNLDGVNAWGAAGSCANVEVVVTAH